MKNETPHMLLELFTPDTVAETFSSVKYGSDLYLYLWNVLVPMAEKVEHIEECGPADVVGVGCVASLWYCIPENFRAELNLAADIEEAANAAFYDAYHGKA